jgi:dihydropteroate synthase
MTSLICGNKILDLSRPAVMGILNITPDSFSDGGQLHTGGRIDQNKTMHAVEAMLAGGADIIDIGGESTRPGASPISVQQELDRVMPILNAVKQRFDCLVSVDTSTAEVMSQAAGAGANMLNDVRALQRDGALQAVAASA